MNAFMIRRLELTPELLLHLRPGCVEVIAQALPLNARIVARGMTERQNFYVDIESEDFTNTDPITPALVRCERCAR